MSSTSTYGVVNEATLAPRPAPELPYRPHVPKDRTVGIALIGCGGITQSHLRAYRNGGFNVVALCSRDRARAEARRAEFFPNAAVTTDYRDLLSRDDVAIVDITTHEGYVPDYPASHGCIRLPSEVARRLFREVPVGTLVTIAN